MTTGGRVQVDSVARQQAGGWWITDASLGADENHHRGSQRLTSTKRGRGHPAGAAQCGVDTKYLRPDGNVHPTLHGAHVL